jgi:hypothetical protein
MSGRHENHCREVVRWSDVVLGESVRKWGIAGAI